MAPILQASQGLGVSRLGLPFLLGSSRCSNNSEGDIRIRVHKRKINGSMRGDDGRLRLESLAMLHEEISNDYKDMIYAGTKQEIATKRTAFIRK